MIYELILFIPYCLIAASFGAGAFIMYRVVSRVYNINIIGVRKCKHEFTKCRKCGYEK